MFYASALSITCFLKPIFTTPYMELKGTLSILSARKAIETEYRRLN